VLTDQPARTLADHRRHLHPDAQGAGQARQAAATLKFFDWAYKNGDKMAADLDYVPLPQREDAGPQAVGGRDQGRGWQAWQVIDRLKNCHHRKRALAQQVSGLFTA
jgi:hypothetical protein